MQSEAAAHSARERAPRRDEAWRDEAWREEAWREDAWREEAPGRIMLLGSTHHATVLHALHAAVGVVHAIACAAMGCTPWGALHATSCSCHRPIALMPSRPRTYPAR